jgi:hypothetical protein
MKEITCRKCFQTKSFVHFRFKRLKSGKVSKRFRDNLCDSCFKWRKKKQSSSTYETLKDLVIDENIDRRAGIDLDFDYW